MLDQVRTYIEQLIARYEAEKTENERLRQELRACEETGAALKKQITELEISRSLQCRCPGRRKSQGR